MQPRLFLLLPDCCFPRAMICELFLTFFKASTLHNSFNHIAYGVLALWLTFEPNVVIQFSVPFDTELERTRPLVAYLVIFARRTA